MQYLHSLVPPHIHRDLKPQNLLVTSNWRIKIADYGVAKLIDTGNNVVGLRRADGAAEADSLAATTQTGTLPYMAPELMLKGKVTYGTEVDVYR